MKSSNAKRYVGGGTEKDANQVYPNAELLFACFALEIGHQPWASSPALSEAPCSHVAQWRGRATEAAAQGWGGVWSQGKKLWPRAASRPRVKSP